MNVFIKVSKDAEIVLKCIIDKSGDFDSLFKLSYRDFKKPIFTNNFLNLICFELQRKGYIESLYESRYDNDFLQLKITHEGYSYFQNKRKSNFKFWFPIILSNILALAALIISIISLIQ